MNFLARLKESLVRMVNIRDAKGSDISLVYVGASPRNIKGSPKKRGKWSKKFRPGLRSVEKKAGIWRKRGKADPGKDRGKSSPGLTKEIDNRAQQRGRLDPSLTKEIDRRAVQRTAKKIDNRPVQNRPVQNMPGKKIPMSGVIDIDDPCSLFCEEIVSGATPAGVAYERLYADEMGEEPPPAESGDYPEDSIPDPQYTPNAMVWVANQEVPLLSYFWEHSGVNAKVIHLRYPDGTPAMARFWLPSMNLTDYLTPLFQGDKSWPFETGPIGRWVERAGGNGERYDIVRPYADTVKGRGGEVLKSVGYGFKKDERGTIYRITAGPPLKERGFYQTEQRYLAAKWMRTFPAAPPGSPNLAGLDTGKSIASGAGWWEWKWKLDWYDISPGVDSYLFLRLFLPGTENVGWTNMPADIYRVDGKDAAAVIPSSLPGSAWLDLNFLTAARLGEKGLPKLVKDDGTLDRQAIQGFIEASRAAPVDSPLNGWHYLLNDDPWRDGNAMLATVYDTQIAKTAFVPRQDGPPIVNPTPAPSEDPYSEGGYVSPAPDGGGYAPPDGGGYAPPDYYGYPPGMDPSGQYGPPPPQERFYFEPLVDEAFYSEDPFDAATPAGVDDQEIEPEADPLE